MKEWEKKGEEKGELGNNLTGQHSSHYYHFQFIDEKYCWARKYPQKKHNWQGLVQFCLNKKLY
jgi:hypothetical protein